jgi:hypothetical protein
MVRIDNFLEGSERISLQKRLQEAVKDKPKEERRKIEMELGKPEKIPGYFGETPGSTTSIEERTIKIIANDKNELDLIERYFKISSFREKNVRDIDMLISFLLAIDSGHLRYDGKDKNLYYISDNDEEVLL